MWRRWWVSALLICSLWASPLLAQPPALSPDQRAAFSGSPEDPEPPVRLGTSEKFEGNSYVVGNEWELHLLYPHVKGLGGGYMGVGADQAYLFIGWMRAEVAWLTDYDPNVVAVHRAHLAFIEQADSPQAYLDLWGKDAQASSQALLERRWADHPELPRILRQFKRARKTIHGRLTKVGAKLRQHQTPSFLTDADEYAHVRQLVKAGRVRPMLANLLDQRALVGVGEAAGKLGVPMRAVYLSNAEQYWPYPDQFRQNMRAQRFDEKSLVVRTLSQSHGGYQYGVQPALNFLDWLASDGARSVWTFLRPGKPGDGKPTAAKRFDKPVPAKRQGKYDPRRAPKNPLDAERAENTRRAKRAAKTP
jgi:hypothetical protein